MANRPTVFISVTASLLGALGVASLVFASRHSLDPMYSGGPAGQGRACSDCHIFNEGGGRVELLGMPRRYRTGDSYDLRVRVTDSQQVGAGFQLSVEGAEGPAGEFELVDTIHTAFAAGGTAPSHVMHTEDGVLDSIAQWGANGGAYEYTVRWHAPDSDVGPLTAFVSGNAIDNDGTFVGDRLYRNYRLSSHAVRGDLDGDEDIDLGDWGIVQSCFDTSAPFSDECALADIEVDAAIDLSDSAELAAIMTGPVAMAPAGFMLADSVRGGQLYDRWWLAAGLPTPGGSHPLYPPNGPQIGSVTYRCKECHGWDYKGRDGAYATGSHATGIIGVYGSQKTASEMFALLRAGLDVQPNGHGLSALGLTPADTWNVVRMVSDDVVDTDPYIDEFGDFVGDTFMGQIEFDIRCAACHGPDGRSLNFGSVADPEYVGSIANANPWEFLHKVRFGQPGTAMLGLELQGVNVQLAADIAAYAATLPTE